MSAIFISWSGSRAKAIATHLKALCDTFGWQTKFSPDIPGGDDWRETLRDYLRATSVALVVLTPEGLESAWIAYEIGAIRTSEKTLVVPVCLGVSQEEIPATLSDLQAINLSERDEDCESIVRELLFKEIDKSLGRATPPQMFDAAFKTAWRTHAEDLLEAIRSPEPPALVFDRPIAQKYFDLAFDSAHVPAYLCRMDGEDFRIGKVNKAGQLLFGLQPGANETLNSMLTRLKPRILNYPSVEQNLGRHFRPQLPIYHAEDIFYRHPEYGLVHFRKVGQIRVSNGNGHPNNPLYLVTFNIRYMDRRDDFYDRLETRTMPQGPETREADDWSKVVWAT